MAEIKLTVPDAAMPRVIDALCDRGGYDTYTPPEGQSKPSRAVFAKRVVIDFVQSVTRNYEAQVASRAAEEAAKAKTEAEVTFS